MRRLLVIGIGTGNPEHLTVQAIKALNEVDVFFVMEKGSEKSDLVDVRKMICHRYITDHDYKTLEIEDPPREKDAGSYIQSVQSWHEQRADRLETALLEEVQESGCGGLLAWGDPTLYDSVIRILEQLRARGNVAFDYEVIPGISSLQMLTARHRIPMNRIGETIRITTGRQLAERAQDIDNVFVMLDGDCSFRHALGQDLDIFWGAYLGTPDEILIRGKLDNVAEDIQRRRREARERHGWIMDIYLLRRPGSATA
ncbi:precorrin-6A synthase [Rhodoligotrophos appendicifer]|uniref:precorrin-6A synthase (deacetylating) n=1 Tax=Rhodoligotrophos appendicifer TaxID=987056 RepID=UPI00117EEA24|nr:precorrin-6A synthase (deacetylating) [Rhodoligotrophos appendicifer]